LVRRTPTKHLYDAIVVGSQLAGALAACVLAKRGFSVLAIPHDGLAKPYVFRDYQFSHGPFLTGALDRIPTLDTVLNEIGLTSLKKTSVHSGLQLLRPRHWFELHPELGHRAREVARALGDSAGEAFLEALDRAAKGHDPTDGFFSSKPDVPPDGWLARWKLKRHLARFEGLLTDSTLKSDDANEALLRSLSNFVAATQGPIVRSRTLSRLFPTPHTFLGGRESVFAALMARARELGADVLDDERVSEIRFSGSSAAGVRLQHFNDDVRGLSVLAACDLSALGPLLPESKQPSCAKLASRLSVSHVVFSTHAVVPERAVPRGLGVLGLIEGTDRGLGPLLFELSPAIKNGTATGERVLTLSVHVSREFRQSGAEVLPKLIDRMWQSTEDVLPFTRPHLVFESTPWRDAPDVRDGVVEPLPTYEVADSILGVTGLSTKSPWPRLFTTSREVLPGLGLEGEAIASMRAVWAVERLLKRTSLKSAR
jgi:hypothetical protein